MLRLSDLETKPFLISVILLLMLAVSTMLPVSYTLLESTCKLTVCFLSANRFDHHQPTFSSTLSSIFPKKTFGNVKLSSAGLIYAHFGHQIISQLMGWPKDDSQTDKLFDKVYDQFIKEIDAIDNGKI